MKHNSNILIYQTEDGQTKIQTRLEDETVWLTIEQIIPPQLIPTTFLKSLFSPSL